MEIVLSKFRWFLICFVLTYINFIVALYYYNIDGINRAMPFIYPFVIGHGAMSLILKNKEMM
jgi:hypothetical protein